MNSFRLLVDTTYSSLTAWMRPAVRERRRLATGLRIGIAGRLLFAFSAVAGLVLFANFIALPGISTARTTTITRYEPRPQQTSIAPAPGMDKAPAPRVPLAVPAHNVAGAAAALTGSVTAMTQALQFRI